jgi:hypothetical protein
MALNLALADCTLESVVLAFILVRIEQCRVCHGSCLLLGRRLA